MPRTGRGGSTMLFKCEGFSKKQPMVLMALYLLALCFFVVAIGFLVAMIVNFQLWLLWAAIGCGFGGVAFIGPTFATAFRFIPDEN